MSDLKEIRLRLGLTQNAIALILDVSRERYAMAEGGHRNVPDFWDSTLKNIIKFEELLKDDQHKNSDIELKQEQNRVVSEIHELIDETNNKLSNDIYFLQRMQNDFAALKLSFDIISHELELFHATKRIAEPLKKEQKSLSKKLKANSPVRQRVLETRIKLWRQQLHEYELLLAELMPASD